MNEDDMRSTYNGWALSMDESTSDDADSQGSAAQGRRGNYVYSARSGQGNSNSYTVSSPAKTFAQTYLNWYNHMPNHNSVNRNNDNNNISATKKGSMMEYVKEPFRIATSPKAKKTYLGTVLFIIVSLALLGIAALAYPIFYYNYVPKKLVSVPIHLQYNAGLNPFGVVSLSPNVMLEQAYDVSITLTLPRSPANLERGNFMIALYALNTAALNPALLLPLPSASSSLLMDPYAHVTPENIVFSSRRPALLPYEDPLVSTASRIIFLLYHVLFPKTSQIEKLEIPMGELVEFRDVLPLSVLVDVQAGQMLQVYDASLTLVARLSGVRWLMYNHRILSFWVCTGIFWVAEMVSTGLAWLTLAHLFSGKGNDGEIMGKGKKRQEFGFGADTSREEEYERRGLPGFKTEEESEEEEKPKIKVEEEGSGDESPGQLPLHHAGDADDEGDGDDIRGGSASAAGRSAFGGTSFDRGTGGSIRRRSSRGDREHLG